jgi:hypothetical protein
MLGNVRIIERECKTELSGANIKDSDIIKAHYRVEEFLGTANRELSARRKQAAEPIVRSPSKGVSGLGMWIKAQKNAAALRTRYFANLDHAP